MACKKGIPCSGKTKFNVHHRCAVCELVDGDNSKKQVAYCSFCSNYICEVHWDDWINRPKAALIEFGNKIKLLLH